MTIPASLRLSEASRPHGPLDLRGIVHKARKIQVEPTMQSGRDDRSGMLEKFRERENRKSVEYSMQNFAFPANLPGVFVEFV